MTAILPYLYIAVGVLLLVVSITTFWWISEGFEDKWSEYLKQTVAGVLVLGLSIGALALALALIAKGVRLL